MDMLRVELGPRSYDIAVFSGGRGLGAFAAERLPGRVALIVTDAHVLSHAQAVASALIASGFGVHTVVVPPGEASKSFAQVEILLRQLADVRADRRTAIVAVGGGVIGDLAGFAAATYARGLPLLMVPTTLLAMVDSSVGGKVGVNLPQGKNLVGAFHQPVGVWIDTASLATLPDREFRSGLAEVVKYGVILDGEFFAWLESNSGALLAREPTALRRAIIRSCEIKAGIVEQDEREVSGLRSLLNFGHTFAHAFEAVTGYGEWLHGEAVAAGMVCASRLAERLGRVGNDVTNRLVDLLTAFGLPTVPPTRNPDALLSNMHLDKKSVEGSLRFVLPSRIGAAELFGGVNDADVRAVLGG